MVGDKIQDMWCHAWGTRQKGPNPQSYFSSKVLTTNNQKLILSEMLWTVCGETSTLFPISSVTLLNNLSPLLLPEFYKVVIHSGLVLNQFLYCRTKPWHRQVFHLNQECRIWSLRNTWPSRNGKKCNNYLEEALASTAGELLGCISCSSLLYSLVKYIYTYSYYKKNWENIKP